VSRRSERFEVRTALVMFGAALLASCHFEQAAIAPLRSAAQTIGAVAALPPAAIVAVGGSQQLGPGVTSLSGDAITQFDSVTYQLESPGDTAFVTLSSSGLVTGKRPTVATVKVNVFVTVNGVTKGDQSFIQVTTAPLANVKLSFFIDQTDSTRLAFGEFKTLFNHLVDTVTDNFLGTPAIRLSVKPADQPRLTVYAPTLSFGTSPITVSAVAAPSDNQIYANDQSGVVWIYGKTLAYGKLLRDSILFELLYPIRGTISVDAAGLGLSSPYQDQLIRLSSGATVAFTNGTPPADSIAIAFTFDVPGHATPVPPQFASAFGGDSGNVTPIYGGQTALRRFPVCAACPAETVAWRATAVSGVAPWKGQTLTGSIYIKP